MEREISLGSVIKLYLLKKVYTVLNCTRHVHANCTMIAQDMSTPLVVLNRDPILDNLFLYPANTAPKFPKVCLTRDTKLDSFAVNNHQVCSSSNPKTTGRPRLRKRRRKRWKLANSFKPDLSLHTIVDRNDRTSSDLHSCEGPSMDVGCLQAMSNTSQSDGSSRTSISESLVRTVSDPPCEDGREQPATSVGTPSINANTSNFKELAEEDFMALLYLCPSEVAAKFRTCTRHRASKYLHINTRNVWNKICSYNEYLQVAENAKRPSWVLLERNSLIDSLSLQSMQGSIHLTEDRRWLFNSYKSLLRKGKSLVVLERDPGLDQLAILTDGSVNSSLHETRARNAPSKLMPQPKTGISKDSALGIQTCQAFEPVQGSISPNSPDISSLETNIGHIEGKHPLKSLFINIKRDFDLDQLALQSSKSSISDSASVNNHQNVSSPSEGRQEGSETHFQRHHKLKSRLIPNLKPQNDIEFSGPRTAAIKLRKMAGKWSVIRHVDRTPNDSVHNVNACKSVADPSSSDDNNPPRSTQLESATENFTRHPRTCRVHLSNVDIHDTHSVYSHPTGEETAQPMTTERSPFLRSTARKVFQEMVTCSISKRRAKSVPSDSGGRHNENKNPHKRVIKLLYDAKLVKHSGLRGKGGLPKGLRSRSVDGRFRSKATISRYMNVKKPLSVKSEINLSSNFSPGASQSKLQN